MLCSLKASKTDRDPGDLDVYATSAASVKVMAVIYLGGRLLFSLGELSGHGLGPLSAKYVGAGVPFQR